MNVRKGVVGVSVLSVHEAPHEQNMHPIQKIPALLSCEPLAVHACWRGMAAAAGNEGREAPPRLQARARTAVPLVSQPDLLLHA